VMKWGRFEVDISIENEARDRSRTTNVPRYLNGLAIISNGVCNYSKGIVPSACWKLLHM
jgi:hypothetical protein